MGEIDEPEHELEAGPESEGERLFSGLRQREVLIHPEMMDDDRFAIDQPLTDLESRTGD